MKLGEKQIRELAAKHGLTVEKRITTGNDKTHFATFELTGPRDAVLEASKSTSKRNLESIQYVNNPGHADYGKPYLECDSVWCETI